MTAGKLKSIENTQKGQESSSPSRTFARPPGVGLSPGGFDATSGPQMAGNMAVQQLFRSGHIQAKLTISQPGDPDEQEADRVADQVMRSAEPASIGSSPSAIHRKCAACEATCPKCEEDQTIQRKEKPGHTAHASPSAHSQIAALRGGGQPLPPSARAFFELRFGRDFSHVRMHIGGHAAATAQAIQARAYTVGQNVVFAAGEYAPGNPEGRKLLAHELTHVLQQGVAQSAIKINRQPTSGGMTSSSASASVVPPTTPPVASVPTAASLENKKLLDAALKSRKPADVLKIKNFSEVPDAQKFNLMAIVLDQWWVDNDDEYALEAIWKSFDERLVPAASSVVGLALWEQCIDAGADLEDIPAIMKLRDSFVPDVTALANGYLDSNDALVVNESANAGIPLNEGPAPGPPTANQQQQMLAMKTAAASVAHAQEEMERSRQVYVGYSLGHVLMEAKQYWLPVTFDPFRPPQRATAPIVDLNDPSPMADHHPVLAPPPGPVTFQSYGELLHAYQLGMTAIRDLVTKHPLIYAVTREGKSATTQSFADADPAAARKQLATDLKKLRVDIALAKAKLGKELNSLDLTPLHDQLFTGMEANSKVNWSLGLPRKLAKGLTQGHDNSKALIALGLESLSQMAFMLGGVLPGAGGVAVSIVGLVATSAKAGISNEQYQAMLVASKVAVAPGTDLVTPAQVDEAKAQNDADQAALQLAMINTAAGIASVAGGWAGRRLGALKKDAGSNVGAPKSKSLAKLPAPKESASSLVSGDTLDVEPAPGAALAPVQGARPKFFWKIISIDPATGECLGVVLDAASEANGTFRINVMTGDGIAISGGQTRVIKGGQIQPPAPAIPSASGQVSPPPSSPPPGAPGQPPGLPGGPTPGPSPLPGQAVPRLPPAGGFENAFPTPQPTGLAAEPNIGGFYPGMRQLPPGYPAYDHVRGGITTVKFTVESFGSPPVKRTVMNLTISGGEWLSDKTVLDAANATPEHIREVVGNALEDMANKSGRKAAYDPVHDWYARVEAASPERVILHIQVPGDARARVMQLQTAADEAAVAAGVGPGVPVEIRVMSWR